MSVEDRLRDIQRGRALPYVGPHREVGYDDMSVSDVQYFIETKIQMGVLRAISDAITQRSNELQEALPYYECH